MKLSAKNQIHRVLALEPNRHSIHAAKLEINDGEGRLIATNGRAIVVIPVEVSKEDEPGLIPREAFTDDRRNECEECGDGWAPPLELAIRGGAATKTHQLAEDSFPKTWEAVIPAPNAPAAVVVKISARLLYDMAAAMDALDCGLTLRIPPPSYKSGEVGGPIRVDGPNGSFGSIMTIKP